MCLESLLICAFIFAKLQELINFAMLKATYFHMRKTKLKYNPETLSYTSSSDSFINTLKNKALTGLFVFIAGILVCGFLLYQFPQFFHFVHESNQLANHQKQLELIKEIEKINKENQIALTSLRENDNKLYRSIYGVDPIDSKIPKHGIGGVERYEHLKHNKNIANILALKTRVDSINAQLKLQKKSFGQLKKIVLNEKEHLACIPAIQPIANKDLTRLSSVFGWRLHPIQKIKKHHNGLDFTAPTGTNVYATGAGIVTRVEYIQGYGKTVEITHTLTNSVETSTYLTRYAHLHSFNVKKNDIVQRGQSIGTVGNTGMSTAPHLHYEVHKNGQPIDPILSFIIDVLPHEYDKMVLIAAQRKSNILIN